MLQAPDAKVARAKVVPHSQDHSAWFTFGHCMQSTSGCPGFLVYNHSAVLLLQLEQL